MIAFLDWLFSFSISYRYLRGGYWERWENGLSPPNYWWFRNQCYRERKQVPVGYKRCVEVDDYRGRKLR